MFVGQAEERAQFEVLKSQMYAERAAKRDRKPKRARAIIEEEPVQKGSQTTSRRTLETVTRGQTLTVLNVPLPAPKENKSRKKSVFDKELTNTSKKTLKQYRAG